MLAREPDRRQRQLPEIVLVAPARNNPARKLLRDHHVGVDRAVHTELTRSCSRDDCPIGNDRAGNGTARLQRDKWDAPLAGPTGQAILAQFGFLPPS